MNTSSRTAIVLYSISATLAAGAIVAVGAARDLSTVSQLEQYQHAYRRAAGIPYPEENAPTRARELLGRTLFFDPRLSGSASISCATCHNPGFSWGDGLPLAIGHGTKQLERRTPTILNLAWAPALLWDGRADTLEEQALDPIEAPSEMNMKLGDMVERIQGVEGYRPLFEKAYPGEGISKDTIAKGIATFERSVVSGRAPFDQWIAGDEHAVSAAAQRGFVLFNEKAGCKTCHSGWRFTDDSFHDIGIAGDDVGRSKVTPRIELSRFAFKTPTLRNVAQRAPYMHDGSVATLVEVMDLYNRGGVTRRPSLSLEIKPLNLTAAETADVVAFLQTLTSQDPEARIPTLPR